MTGKVTRLSALLRAVCTAWALPVLLVAATAGGAVAEDKPGMREKVRALGIGIGNAYVCTEEADRAEFKEEAQYLFDLILQDVGSDMAYIYAVGLGYGSSVSIDKLDCPDMLQQWQEIREDHELARAE